jgi:hypothetical protein
MDASRHTFRKHARGGVCNDRSPTISRQLELTRTQHSGSRLEWCHKDGEKGKASLQGTSSVTATLTVPCRVACRHHGLKTGAGGNTVPHRRQSILVSQ